MNRPDDGNVIRPADACLALLHRAGWSIGDAAFPDGAGGLSWLVSGHNGENLIRAEGLTQAQAWGGAVATSRSDLDATKGVGSSDTLWQPPP